ncbi:MAG: transposase [Hyphomicrobiaceae bacterium]
MLGRRKSEQGQLFYAFDLEAVVPDDHQVRLIAAVFDLAWVRTELAPHYSHTGRPSIDPELMIRMLILGYVFAIRSERALCREVQVNLACLWFCGLGIEDRIPDHSAFACARIERFREHDVFRQVFERVLAACIKADLVGGKGFAVDASLIAADANKCGSTPGNAWSRDIDPATVERAVQDYLANLDKPDSAPPAAMVPKFVAPADPAAQWTGALRNAAFFAYADNYLIDGSSASSWMSRRRAPFARPKSARSSSSCSPPSPRTCDASQSLRLVARRLRQPRVWRQRTVRSVGDVLLREKRQSTCVRTAAPPRAKRQAQSAPRPRNARLGDFRNKIGPLQP